jgi:hypothetical protein
VTAITYFIMDMRAFSNEAKRASMTYQKVLELLNSLHAALINPKILLTMLTLMHLLPL